MKLPDCSQEGRHHFSLCLSADSSLLGPYGDLDHQRKHRPSACLLNCLLILSSLLLPLDHLPRSALEFYTVSVALLFKLNTVMIHCPRSSP